MVDILVFLSRRHSLGVSGKSRSIPQGKKISDIGGTKSNENCLRKRAIIPPDLSDGEDADSLLVQVNRRLRQHLNIDNPSVFDIPPSLMEL